MNDPQRVLFSLALLAASGGYSFASEWLCIPEKAGGFIFENGGWAHARFSVEGKSMVVAEVVPRAGFDGQPVGIEVTHTGDKFPIHTCAAFQEGQDQIACGGLGYGFLFNRSNLRYQELYGIGFVNGGDSPDNTPMLEIGRCTKLPDRN